MGGLNNNEYYDKKLEVKEGVSLTTEEQEAVNAVNKFLSFNIANKRNSEADLNTVKNNISVKRSHTLSDKAFLTAIEKISTHIDSGNVIIVDDITTLDNIYRNFEVKEKSQKIIGRFFSSLNPNNPGIPSGIATNYENLQKLDISPGLKQKLTDKFMLDLDKIKEEKQAKFNQTIAGYRQQKEKITIYTIQEASFAQNNNYSSINNDIDSLDKMIKKSENSIESLDEILSSYNKTIKNARVVETKGPPPNIISKIDNNVDGNIEQEIEDKKFQLQSSIIELKHHKINLNYKKRETPIIEKSNDIKNIIPFDLSDLSIKYYKFFIQKFKNYPNREDSGYFTNLKKDIIKYLKEYNISKNIDSINFGKANDDGLGFSSLEKGYKLADKDIFLEKLGFPTNMDGDKRLLDNIDDIGNPTKVLGLYNKIQQIVGLSEYGQAIKQKWIQQIREIMPQNEVKNEQINIVAGFSDNLYNQLKANPTCYILFDGKVYGGTEEQRKSIEVGEGDNLKKFIQKDFALLASKYVSYDHFMLAINSENTNFSGKKKLTEDQYKILYNYIKYGSPNPSSDYNFSLIGDSGQCKEIKELQGLLNTLDPRLSNKLDANNDAGVDGKYGFATAETFRSLLGVLNQDSNEIEYFAQFEQVHLFQDVSGSMTSVTPIVENNIKMYDNGSTNMNFHSNLQGYGGNGVEKGLNQIKEYISNNLDALEQSNDKKLFRIYTDEKDQSEEDNVGIILNLMSQINGTCDIVVCKNNKFTSNSIESKIIPLQRLFSDKNLKTIFFNTNKDNPDGSPLFEDIKNYEGLSDFNLSQAPQSYLTTGNKQDFLFGILQLSPSQQLRYFSFISKKATGFSIKIEDIQNLWKFINDYSKSNPQPSPENFWTSVDSILGKKDSV